MHAHWSLVHPMREAHRTECIKQASNSGKSGHSTQSAVDIFNTLYVFTKEPIREQEIKLECMDSLLIN